MTDDERAATGRPMARYRRREILLWFVILLAVGGLAVGIPAIAKLTGTGSTLAIVVVMFSGVWLCFGVWLAPMYTVDFRRLRRDLAAMRIAGARDGGPAPGATLEIA